MGNRFSEEQIVAQLRAQGYGKCEALATAHDLADFQAEYANDLRAALAQWMRSPHSRIKVSEGGYSTDSLMAGFGMTYPAALVTIDWLRSDPAQARACLASRGECR